MASSEENQRQPEYPSENTMASWTDGKAELILDELTALDGPDDLRVLQGAIERALLQSF